MPAHGSPARIWHVGRLGARVRAIHATQDRVDKNMPFQDARMTHVTLTEKKVIGAVTVAAKHGPRLRRLSGVATCGLSAANREPHAASLISGKGRESPTPVWDPRGRCHFRTIPLFIVPSGRIDDAWGSRFPSRCHPHASKSITVHLFHA